MWGRRNILQRKFLLLIRHKIALLIVLMCFTCFSTKLIAQRGFEIGPTAGASYYMGDLNMYKHFYSSNLNLGVFMKYHTNPRVAIRLNAYYTKLSANDKDFNLIFQQQREHSFETNLIEISSLFEVTFLPYEIGDIKKKSFTPYIHTGLAAFLISSKEGISLAIPIGIGLKKNIKPRLVVGIEWTFRRSFSDNIDNLTGEDLQYYDPAYGVNINQANIHKQYGFLYNKDWYSFANLTISYTFKLGGLGCPAYYE